MSYLLPRADVQQLDVLFNLDSFLCRYAAPLYVDMKKTVRTKLPEDEGGDWSEDVDEYPKVFIGEVGTSNCHTPSWLGLLLVCEGPAVTTLTHTHD
jgi:hypothetical protein